MKAAVLYMAGLSLFTACAKDTDNILRDSSVKGFTITTYVNGYVPEDSDMDTRASTSGYTFNFTSGDAIGVIGLKNGNVMENCNNVKLTYTGSGKWASDDLYDFGATSYIAYYPFSSSMSGKASVDAIKNAFTIKTDQSSEADFNASNLLTATASLSAGKLQFNFTPAFALVEIAKPDALEGYSNLSGENYTYKFYSNATTSELTLNPGTGFFEAGNKTYRKIIKASTDTQIDMTVTIKNQLTVSYPKKVNITSGNYKRLVCAPIKRNLVVGDFVYNMNGEIAFLPENLTAPATNDCIGVIYWRGDVTKQDGLMKKNGASWKHGLVCALKESTMKWSTDSENITTNWFNGKGSTYGISRIDGDGIIGDAGTGTLMQGYANTQALKDYNAYKGASSSYRVLPVDYVQTYSASNKTPGSTSGWYCPSFEELKYVLWGQGSSSINTSSKDMLNKQFQKLSIANQIGTAPCYYSSTETNTEVSGLGSKLRVWSMLSSGSFGPIGKANSYPVRLIFAF